MFRLSLGEAKVFLVVLILAGIFISPYFLVFALINFLLMLPKLREEKEYKEEQKSIKESYLNEEKFKLENYKDYDKKDELLVLYKAAMLGLASEDEKDRFNSIKILYEIFGDEEHSWLAMHVSDANGVPYKYKNIRDIMDFQIKKLAETSYNLKYDAVFLKSKIDELPECKDWWEK